MTKTAEKKTTGTKASVPVPKTEVGVIGVFLAGHSKAEIPLLQKALENEAHFNRIASEKKDEKIASMALVMCFGGANLEKHEISAAFEKAEQVLKMKAEAEKETTETEE